MIQDQFGSFYFSKPGQFFPLKWFRGRNKKSRRKRITQSIFQCSIHNTEQMLVQYERKGASLMPKCPEGDSWKWRHLCVSVKESCEACVSLWSRLTQFIVSDWNKTNSSGIASSKITCIEYEHGGQDKRFIISKTGEWKILLHWQGRVLIWKCLSLDVLLVNSYCHN